MSKNVCMCITVTTSLRDLHDGAQNFSNADKSRDYVLLGQAHVVREPGLLVLVVRGSQSADTQR